MRGVKGFFVYGKSHLSRENHSREEVTSNVKRLKERELSAMV